ncbi:MAG: hypoxanthine phosphoribosyltransferase [Clostridia bacterium]|nr:hypoxanthine phosphoribosyltransferase [Clostridia bacterium]
MPRELYNDLQPEILITRDQLAARVAELGAQITKDYEGKELVLVCILKGAVMFLADLLREIDLPVTIDFVAISSYGSATKSSGVVRIMKDLDRDIVEKHVLVVEDIIDTGLTMSFLKNNLLSRGAASIRVCSLLDKPERRLVRLSSDYTGFTVPDAFVVGYGLDYDQRYRNLPEIGLLKPEIYES